MALELFCGIVDLLQKLDYEEIEEIRRLRLPRTVLRDRSDPMVYLTEEEFIQRYRLSKDGVRDVLEEITPYLGRIRDGRGSSVPQYLQLLVSLRYMATGNFQITLSDCAEMSAASVCRFVRRIATAIASTAPRHIHFPDHQEAHAIVNEFYRIAQLPGVIGCVDGIHIKIKSPGGDDPEQYRCRKGFMSLNVQGACDAKLRFTNIVCSWSGSTHDARIFENSRIYTKLEHGEYSGHLLGDSAYPCTPFLLTPILNPRNEKEERYNAAHIRTRNTIERAFGVWKRRFRILSIPMQTKLGTTKLIIMACAILHNIAISRQYPLVDEPCCPEGNDDNDVNEVRHAAAAADDEDDDDINGGEMAVDGAEEGANKRRLLIERWF
ncbi:putative nuclease HARBI1 isoform X1 [Portunus trituberculatus]|uniref:putative nuclease HARBI1 isoform X1 n=2 Tax=Portunus trituberculatus TaxID=210409 RepID=UPI001E1CDF2C|nr:putative nuclease HARBI1 isoform X1 [Portunus trituberculatus]